jgi:hypothetical protein
MRESDDSMWTMVGENSLRLEPPETVSARIRGVLNVEATRELLGAMRRLCEGKARIFLLGDISGLQGMPGDARKVAAELLLGIPVASTAIFGASFAQRVVATLADKTSNLIRGSSAYETRFFATEAQARAWLGQQRERGAPGKRKG